MAGEAKLVGAPPLPAIDTERVQRRPVNRAATLRSFAVTFLAIVVLAAFLSPMLRTVTTALKSTDQITQAGAPLWPADSATFEFEGREYDVYHVPMPDGTFRDLALVTKGRQESEFVDPADPGAGLITWQGSWRALQNSWQLAPKWSNFADVWEIIDFPRLLFNTAALAVIGTIGTLLSCVVVAYGFARFRFPGRGALFTLVLSTIFLPAAVTLIPTYAVFVKLGWVGSYLPLLVPAFFANAYDVFLLRQYLMTIPRDHDEAAMIDGAGAFRILRSVILPQAWPVIVAVAIFTFVYSWNDYFGPLIYLAGNEEAQPLQVALAHFHSIYHAESTLIQAGNIMTLIPTYTIFVKLGWVGTWLPLLVPAFFANAYDVFLLRQYFLTLPRELDDAAKIDGAGPFRVLTSIIIPQSWAVIIAVAVFHLVYTWNLYFEPLLYLSSKPDLQPIATGLAAFNSIYGSSPELVQAATLMTIIIPMAVFFVAQRAFMRGIVITGVEK